MITTLQTDSNVAAKTQRSAPASIRDVAKRAGVAISTVSYALNRSELLKEETCDRVRKAVAELGYVPNHQAKVLRSQAKDTLSLIVPASMIQVDPLFFGLVAGQLLLAAAEEGFSVITETLPAMCPRTGDASPHVIQRGVGGLVLLGDIGMETCREIRRLDLPMCSLGRPFPEDKAVPSVELDYASGAMDAIRYLAASGHRNIAVVHGSLAYSSSCVKRACYQRALSSIGFDIRPELFFEVPREQHSFRGGYAATAALLALAKRPTAAVYENDWFAVGGMKAASDMGISVPEEFSVIGWDDSPFAREMMPALTTVSADFGAMARMAVDVVHRQISGRPFKDGVAHVRPTLMQRGSCSTCQERANG